MAINKEKTKQLINQMEELIDAVTKNVPGEGKKFLKDMIFSKAFKVLKETIEDSRPPRLFIVGRSGHGKSSVINALAGKEIAEIDDIRSCTPESIPYEISFSERYSNWTVIDSRGIFETIRPDGAVEANASEVLARDIIQYKPDVIMHVISITEIRAMGHDMIEFKNIYKKVKKAINKDIPTFIVLTKADIIGHPREWPPEAFPKKAGQIKSAVELMIDILEVEKYTPLDANAPLLGVEIEDDKYLGIIPVCSLENDIWNIELLSNFIGECLPECARLDFFQPLHNKAQLLKLSDSFIKKFAAIAGGIGASPMPLPDIIILTPIQIILVCIIGGLSCREFSKETALEFFSAAGINVGVAFGLKEVARNLVKLIPIVGWGTSGVVASSGTYAIGKAAEAYFFDKKIIDLKEFVTKPE